MLDFAQFTAEGAVDPYLTSLEHELLHHPQERRQEATLTLFMTAIISEEFQNLLGCTLG